MRSVRSLSIVRVAAQVEVKMQAFAECEEHKERVKACYADWFHKLWGGSFDRANCDQETQDYRQCVQDAMQRRAEEEKREASHKETAWMDRTKEKSEEMVNAAKTRVSEARERAERLAREEKEAVEGKVHDVGSKVYEAADSWTGKLKNLTKKAGDKTEEKKDEAADKAKHYKEKAADKAKQHQEKK
ncbi:hypothetical protein BBJ28_00005491 [Nothophytophthora sp. Chile5]|nr:hypothetical protein BBJ28_00005491 [Nothophytophthora sp. Chile5]